MTAGTDLFGDIADLATALGVVDSGGNVSTDFFVDPAATIGGTLRDATRRAALLAFLDDVLGDSAPQVQDAGASWTPIFQLSSDVHLYLVTAQLADGLSVGIGVRGATSGTPSASGQLSLPLVVIPASGEAVFLPGSTSKDAVAQLQAEVDVDSPSLRSVSLTAAIPIGAAATGSLAISVTGLVVPGSATPLDLTLDADAEIGPQLLHVVSTLVETELQAAAADIGPQAATLLGLLGLAPDSVVPLPLADLATRGLAALRDWLGSLAASDTALQAWFGHLAGLVGAAVTPGTLTASLALATDVDLTLALAVDTDDTGGRRFAPSVGIGATVATDTAVELTATLFQASVGAHPAVSALPALECHARYGAASGPSTILDVTEAGVLVQVGALRAGVGLDASRRPVFVLAADRVVLGPTGSPTTHDVLDLTSPDALAEVGGAALSSVLAGLISSLGAAGTSVSELLGLATPPSWTGGGWPSIDAGALIADPVKAWLGFQHSVLALGTQAFADLLSAASGLLGLPDVADAAGTAADPWLIASTGGLALVAWTTTEAGVATLHLGARWQPSGSQVGGANGPTPSLQLLAEALAITLPSGSTPVGLHVLPSVSLAAGLSTPAGHPLQVSLGAATLAIPGVEATLGWTTADGAQAAFDLPGATVTVDATTLPFALPSLDGAGNLVLPAGLDDHALEVLLAGALEQAGPPWLAPLAQALGLGDPSAAGASFATLLSDPRAWLAARLRALLTDADPAAVDATLTRIAAVVASLVGTPSVPPPQGATVSGSGPATVTGTGRPDDPLVIALQTGAAEVDLTLWLDPDGPPIPPAVLTALLQPTALADWLAGTGTALATSDLTGLLTSAGAHIPALGGLMAGRDAIATGWDALVARCTGGDGLLPGGAPDIVGATSSTLAGVAHADLPAHLDLTALAGLPTGTRVLYVTGPYVPAWPDTSLQTLDLTAAGLAATAFDTSALAASTDPWQVRLPFRDDCPGTDAASRAQACAARLAAAITAAASGGSSVLVVAHGPAACGTAQLAVTGAPVVGLVLLGAAAAAVPLDVLDQAPAGDALALARRLLPADATGDGPDLALARSVIGQFGQLLDATHDPSVDLTPPAGLAASTVPVWSVRGALDATALTRSLGGLVQAGLAAFQPGTGLPGNPGAPAPAAPTALRAGLRVQVPLPASVTTDDPTGISLDVAARLDLGGLALATSASVPPAALQLDVEIYRANGWLAGGPQGSAPAPGTLRTPSLRRAAVSVGADLTGGLRGARATITLYDASALGATRDAWVLGSGGEQLGAETRVLLGRLASALSPLPTGGPIGALADLLAAVGLTDPTTTLPTIGLSVDAVQQLLLDPLNALRAGFSSGTALSAVADALRRLLGLGGTGNLVQASIGALEIGLDLGASPPALTVATTGIALGGGPALTGNAKVDTAGNWSGTVALTPPSSLTGQGVAGFGAPSLRIALGAAPTVSLAFGTAPASGTASSGLPASIALYPPPTSGQLAGIAQTALTAAASAALRALVTALRTDVLSAPQLATLDPVLESLGLLSAASGTPTLTLPFGLFTDPVGYLAHAVGWQAGSGPAADQLATLLDGVRTLLGLPSAAHGTLPLSTSVSLTAGAATTGGLRLAIGYTGSEGNLATTIDAGLTLAAGAAPLPHLDASLGLAGHTASVALALDGAALSVTLHTSSGDIALLPSGPGLGSLATTAVQQALPYVLNALHDGAPAPIPAVLDAVREVLGLGATGFDGTQLQQLAADPGGQLLARLVAYGSSAFAQLQAILPSLPAPWSVSAGTSSLRVAYGAQWVQLSLAGSPPVLTVETSITADLPGITGASVSLGATLDTTGLRGLTASGQVAPADALAIGPLSFAPVIEISVGPAASPARFEAGIVVADGTHTRAALLSVALAPVAVSLVTQTDGVADPGADPAVVVTHVLVPLVADAALHETHVQALLATPVGGSTLQGLLNGVLLTGGGEFDTGLLALNPTDLMGRLTTLIANVAGAAPPLALPDNLQLSFSGGALRGLAITVAPGQRADLISGGDIGLAIEVDDSWVNPALTPPGISVMVIDTSSHPPTFIPPVITVDGVGLRLYRRSGPLLDSVLSIGSIGLFGLLRIDAGHGGLTDGGVALQLADVAIAPASATGGSNGVAQGILGNTKQSGGGGDSTPLKPTFSPELALQQRQGASGLAWSLTAGPGNGPWLVHIGRSFGPLRVDDVGFGDDVTNGQVTAIRILISGGISLAGLNLDVDELSIGAPWPTSSGGKALTDPSAWSLDLAGLDVSYSGGGVQLAGGLRRRDNPSLPGNPPDYVGVLLARVGPYGLTAFGGYGQFPSPTGNFTALFVFAAINAPIGGPPAFFVTGIGGGAGINRALILPTDLDDFATFPMIAALDPNSTLASNPEKAMDLLSTSFPPQQGTFWFAAGVSFTSFALIDVVAVVAVEVGNGFTVALLGLARAALPTAYLPLAQLELAMMAEFSTAEGVLEIRAQLTDNSYLLTRDCRLTGGFAYASWFGANPNAGQFVVSIGGYHPSFNRPDYPVVPRVGFRWDLLGCLTITGQAYFALTSEAIMAGASFTAALVLGPLWASLSLGVDAIVYFDPFHFDATGYASIAAGITITIDLLFGSVTVSLSFHLGAQVEVSGPDFHGSATIDLDVTSATIAFGGSTDTSTSTLGWSAFAAKYLTGSGGKPVLSAAVGAGAITPAGGAATPDGSAGSPWLFVPEFSLSVASTAAADSAAATVNVSTPVPLGGSGWTTAGYALDGSLAIAPMGVGAISSTLGVSVVSADGQDLDPIAFSATPVGGLSLALVAAPLPKGVWAAQLAGGEIPTGDTITAGTGLTLTAAAEIAAGSPPINYDQVQPGQRQPLPFAVEEAARPALDPDAANAATFAADAGTDANTVLAAAQSYLNGGLFATPMSPLAAATFRRDRVAPPRLALLTDGIAPPNVVPPTLAPIVPPVKPPLDTTIKPPVVTALLAGGAIAQQRQLARTTASTAVARLSRSARRAAAITRVPAPTIASMTAALDPALGARLVRGAPLAHGVVQLSKRGTGGLAASDGGPVTRRAAAPREVQALPVLDPGAAALVAAHQAALLANGSTLRPGDVLVTTLPNHEADIDPNAQRPTIDVAGDAAVRVIALSALGEVLADQTTAQGNVEVPAHTARLVAWCVGGIGADPTGGSPAGSAAVAGLAGWASTDRLPYVGAGVTLGCDCVITGLPAPRRGGRRASAGHQLAAGAAAASAASGQVIRTLLPAGTSVVVVSLDAAPGADVGGVTLGLDGASRLLGADGTPTPPVVVSANGRTHLLYDLAPSVLTDATPPRVGMSVGTDPNWTVVGVMGGVSTAADTASLLAATGVAGLLGALLRSPTGSALLHWSGPTPVSSMPPRQVSLTDTALPETTLPETTLPEGAH